MIVIETMGIGAAVTMLERGRRVARRSWTGTYLFLAAGSASQRGALFSVTASSPEPLPIDDAICMRTALGTIQPGWSASQADLLAKDWIEVE